MAPHPDDETLGCGSLIAHAVCRGIRVTVIALTDGDASHPASRRWPPAGLGHLRAGETRRALARLGASAARVRRLRWRDGRVGADARIAHLRRALVASDPGVVLVTSDADHHPDHQAAARLAGQAARALGLPLVHYAVWSRTQETRSMPGRYHRAKLWAAAAHRSQVGGYIVDDPDGFRLSAADLSSLVGSAETFVRA